MYKYVACEGEKVDKRGSEEVRNTESKRNGLKGREPRGCPL